MIDSSQRIALYKCADPSKSILVFTCAATVQGISWFLLHACNWLPFFQTGIIWSSAWIIIPKWSKFSFTIPSLHWAWWLFEVWLSLSKELLLRWIRQHVSNLHQPAQSWWMQELHTLRSWWVIQKKVMDGCMHVFLKSIIISYTANHCCWFPQPLYNCG